MRPGFALVEAGFSRTKNTTNILFKNLMDFCMGSLAFWLSLYLSHLRSLGLGRRMAFAVWAAITGSILFTTIKFTIGLRVSSREEEIGLDYFEHGEKAYN